MKIDANKTIAVAVDYQERLMPVMEGKEELLEHSEILLKGLRTLEIPIILTQQYTRGLGMTVKEITDAAGTEDYQEKISYSAYEELSPLIEGKPMLLCVE